jgi:hypothetical protein
MKYIFILISLLSISIIKSEETLEFDIKAASKVKTLASGADVELTITVSANTAVTLANGNLALQKTGGTKIALTCPTSAITVTQAEGADVTCTTGEAINTDGEYGVVAGATPYTLTDYTISYGNTKITILPILTASIKVAKSVTSIKTTDTVDITVKASSNVAKAITFAEGVLALSTDGTTKVNLLDCTETANTITTAGVDITCKPKTEISTSGNYGLYLGSVAFSDSDVSLAATPTPVITVGSSGDNGGGNNGNNNAGGGNNDDNKNNGNFIKCFGFIFLCLLF